MGRRRRRRRSGGSAGKGGIGEIGGEFGTTEVAGHAGEKPIWLI